MDKSSNALRKINSWHPFLRNLCAPFVMTYFHGVEFFVWIMFVVVAGQLGTIINVIARVGFQGWSLLPSLCSDSASGSFYTFALVLTASLIVPNFLRIEHREKPQLKTMTIIFVTLSFFLMILSAVYYSFASQNREIADYSHLTNEDVTIDWPQAIIFVSSLIFACYSFGMEYVRYHNELKSIDPDWLAEDNNQREDLGKNYSTIKSDMEGITL